MRARGRVVADAPLVFPRVVRQHCRRHRRRRKRRRSGASLASDATSARPRCRGRGSPAAAVHLLLAVHEHLTGEAGERVHDEEAADRVHPRSWFRPTIVFWSWVIRSPSLCRLSDSLSHFGGKRDIDPLLSSSSVSLMIFCVQSGRFQTLKRAGLQPHALFASVSFDTTSVPRRARPTLSWNISLKSCEALICCGSGSGFEPHSIQFNSIHLATK